MTRNVSTDRILSLTYAAIAAGAFVATQSALVAFVRQPDHGWLTGFVRETVANPGATFMTLDVTFVALAALVLMIVEGRRLGMRHLWVYVVLTFAVAISVAFPLFLLVRQRRLAEGSDGVVGSHAV